MPLEFPILCQAIKQLMKEGRGVSVVCSSVKPKGLFYPHNILQPIYVIES